MDVTETEPNARIATAFAAITGRVVALDMAFFRLLAAVNLPKSVAYFLILLVRSGDGWIWALIACALWLFLPFAEMERVVLHCILAFAISLAIYFPVKFLGRRLRPYEKGLPIKPLVPPLDKFSFPSGHTMNNLAVALTLAAHFPVLFLPAIAIPILLGALRVFFGVHFLSDIIGGGVLGAFAFTLAKAFFPLSGS